MPTFQLKGRPMVARAKDISRGDYVVVIRDGIAWLGVCTRADKYSSPPSWTVRLFFNSEVVEVPARKVFRVLPQSDSLATCEVLS